MMEKVPASPPTSEATSESPTLSDHPNSSKKFKRKRSNIFSKLRKSILGLGGGNNNSEEQTSDNKFVENDRNKRNSLKRAMSIDSGLQNRISQLITSSTGQEPVTTEFNPETQMKRRSGVRNRRSKSLHHRNNSLEQIDETCTNPTSPTIGDSIDPLSTINTPLLTRTTSLIDTVDLAYKTPSSMIQRFNCSWLAPTRRSQLFPGTLSIHPHSSSIQFHGQHLDRTIRLQFHFQDILNIAQGTWNEARNQALIIDLVKGKRKSWVFVAWGEFNFNQAIEAFVQAWNKYTLSQINQRIDRKNAHLNMKYCKIIRDADRANESTSRPIFSNLFHRLLIGVKEKFFKNEPKTEIIKNDHKKDLSLKNLIYQCEIDCVVPQVLGSILTDRASNFMTNFRALQGIDITNDSGWMNEKKRSFNCLITKEDDRMRSSKWRVTQESLIEDPDQVIIKSTYTPISSSKATLVLMTVISSISIENNNPALKCNVKITGELKKRDNYFFTEDQLCTYFCENVYKPLFVLLEAFIRESHNEFLTFQHQFQGDSVLPQYRFLKEIIKNRLLMLNVGFTTIILPFLYKLIHFKEYKIIRLMIFCCIAFNLIKSIDLKFMWESFKISSSENFNAAFKDYMKDLAREALEGEGAIHSLKLKYTK